MLGPQTLLLARYMDLLSVRQKVTGTNIANADTPGYKTRDIHFDIELARALQGVDAAEPGPLEVHQVGGLAVKNDGNDVSLDREMERLPESVIRYGLASLLVRGNISAVRNAILEGRGG